MASVSQPLLMRWYRDPAAAGSTVGAAGWRPADARTAALTRGRPRVETFLQGFDEIVRSVGANETVKSVSVAFNRAGYEQAYRAAMPATDAARQADMSAAHFQPRSGSVNIGDYYGRALGTHFAGKDIDPQLGMMTAHVVRHELEHAVTPNPARSLQWLEEATAELGANAPGELVRSAHLLGLPAADGPRVRERAHNHAYKPWQTSLELWMGAAGLDTSQPDDRTSARTLLQHAPTTLVAAERLAERVGANQGWTDLGAARRAIAPMILENDGGPAQTKDMLDRIAGLAWHARSGAATGGA